MAARKPATSKIAPAAQSIRRSARLRGETAGAAAGPSKNDDRALVTKPKPAKQKSQKYECTTCGRTLAGSSFPKYLPTDSCNHLINTCKACCKLHISTQLDSVTYEKVACPECPEIMQNEDVKLLAAKAVYERFDDLERRGIAEKVPGWRWCMNPKCRSGQVHEPLIKKHEAVKEAVAVSEAQETKKRGKAKRAKKSKMPGSFIDLTSDDEDEKEGDHICVCNSCGHKACVDCDRPYHDGETCAQYQKRRKRQTETEEKQTAKTIENSCKACPNCGKNIEKNGGCDAVHCMCGEFFCYLCVTPYSVINQSGHGNGCAYAGANRFDPHAAALAPGGIAGLA